MSSSSLSFASEIDYQEAVQFIGRVSLVKSAFDELVKAVEEYSKFSCRPISTWPEDDQLYAKTKASMLNRDMADKLTICKSLLKNRAEKLT